MTSIKSLQGIHGVTMPDSKLATDALALVAEASSDFLLNHSLRVYAFGALLCVQHKRNFDPELGFVAAVMHDLGLTDRYATPDHRFEVDGADAAREFLADHDITGDSAELVWDAIALHTAFGIAERKAPEVALVHYGINMDVGGAGSDMLTHNQIKAVMHTYPRPGFQEKFRSLVAEHANRRPVCHRYTWAGWVAEEYAARPEVSAAETLHSAYWTQ